MGGPLRLARWIALAGAVFGLGFWLAGLAVFTLWGLLLP